jgi:hypothetical protein
VRVEILRNMESTPKGPPRFIAPHCHCLHGPLSLSSHVGQSFPDTIAVKVILGMKLPDQIVLPEIGITDNAQMRPLC